MKFECKLRNKILLLAKVTFDKTTKSTSNYLHNKVLLLAKAIPSTKQRNPRVIYKKKVLLLLKATFDETTEATSNSHDEVHKRTDPSISNITQSMLFFIIKCFE